ncbi:DUF5317 domain-containing protein [Euzebya tangerina]|uniref:DUF5317 domain-containing protein n=1 Tax=Euzebya tangerina TaxID=591198 RepID=UPI000E31DD2B|nr:DUF5317 domain-containing protein [Euzebya tangerina]
MIVLVLALLIVASVPLTGGSLAAVTTLRLQAAWIPLVAIVVQTAAIEGPLAGLEMVPLVLHVGSYGLIVYFLWRNRAIQGLTMITVGAACNLAAITMNGGVMPATPWATSVAGLVADGEFANSSVSAGSPLWFLGDVFAIPASWPLSNVFSVGDIMLVVGLAEMLHLLARQPVEPDQAGARWSSTIGQTA